MPLTALFSCRRIFWVQGCFIRCVRLLVVFPAPSVVTLYHLFVCLLVCLLVVLVRLRGDVTANDSHGASVYEHHLLANTALTSAHELA